MAYAQYSMTYNYYSNYGTTSVSYTHLVDNLLGAPLFVDYFNQKYADVHDETMVVSPDAVSYTHLPTPVSS